MAESDPPHTGRIFISYRRDDTAYPAGWLFDRLKDHFGQGQVFKDVDSIDLGDDFVEKITKAVDSCDVLLALIGDRWLLAKDDAGSPLLANPNDFVRLEIETALARTIRVIPILVAGAQMPRVDQVPPSLAKLVRRQALELSPSRFDFDLSRLLRVLDRTLAEGGDKGLTEQSSSGRSATTADTHFPTPAGIPPDRETGAQEHHALTTPDAGARRTRSQASEPRVGGGEHVNLPPSRSPAETELQVGAGNVEVRPRHPRRSAIGPVLVSLVRSRWSGSHRRLAGVFAAVVVLAAGTLTLNRMTTRPPDAATPELALPATTVTSTSLAKTPVSPPTTETFPPLDFPIVDPCEVRPSCIAPLYTAPSLGSTEVGTAREGQTVRVDCQARGELVRSEKQPSKSSVIWNRLVDGTWVSDLYIGTGVDGFFPDLARCT